MTLQRQLQVALVLLCTGVFLHSAAQPYTLNVVRGQPSEKRNMITLECVDDANHPVEGVVEYQYRPSLLAGGSQPIPVTLNGDTRRSVEFELTPQTEGAYFCRVGGVTGVESVLRELVVSPERISSIEMVDAYTIQQGENLELDCDFEEGQLSNRYSFRWFRRRFGSLDQLYDGTETSDSMRFEVIVSTQNGRSLNSFRITGVEFGDESDQYYCVVMITDPGGSNPASATGRFIRVDVYDEVHVEMEASPQVVLEGNTAQPQFQCTFEGDPSPNITWRLNGAEVQSGGDFGRFLITSFSQQERSITSTFTILSTKAQDNGIVECEALNVNSLGTQFTAASSTTLTVLSSNISDLFLTTTTLRNDPAVFLHFMLPARFVTPVIVTAQYRDAEDPDEVSLPIDYNNVFGDTKEVNFRIPDVPRFSNFTTQIYFSSPDGMTTMPIVAGPIVVPRAGLGGLQPSNDDNGFLFSTNFIVVVVVGGVVIVALFAFGVIGAVCHERSRMKASAPVGAPLPVGRRAADFAELSEEEIELPWQALFSVKDGPWQASWHLYAVKQVIYTSQISQTEITKIDIDIEIETVTVDVRVNAPWQATLQESLPWEARDTIIFKYSYLRIETSTEMVVDHSQEKDIQKMESDGVVRQDEQEEETSLIQEETEL